MEGKKSVSRYERAILKQRLMFIAYSAATLVVMLATIWIIFYWGKPSIWLSRAGAVMAVLAFMAHLKANEMIRIISPAGLVDISFAETKVRYLSQIILFEKVAIALVISGGVIWGFGDVFVDSVR